MNSFSYFLDYKFSKSFAETTDVNFGRESVELDSADPGEPAYQSSMWSEEEREEKKGLPMFHYGHNWFQNSFDPQFVLCRDVKSFM